VVTVLAGGALVALFVYLINGALLRATGIAWEPFSRYLAPAVEEAAKGSLVLALIRLGRIGFLVDAAICGFAVGAGFALVENAWYLMALASPAVGLGTWVVRGFGTAMMHGGVTAIFALAALGALERPGRAHGWALLGAFGLAWAVHSAYNHAWLNPLHQTALLLVLMPMMLVAVFQRSERSLGDWLGRGLDRDAELLRLIHSGRFGESSIGRYLETLRGRFAGEVVADLLCYLRVHTQLSMRAKGLLLMRESGLEAPITEVIHRQLEELRYLERSIGRSGLLAIRPLLHHSRKDVRQLQLIR
jgi:hypothetical protein